MKKIIFSIVLLFLVLAVLPFSSATPLFASSNDSVANSTNIVCAVYFTGVGCPHCAKVKPIIDDVVNRTHNLILIKYEVQEIKENAPVLSTYASAYGVKPGIPLMLFGKDNYLQGDSPIINDLESKVKSLTSNSCPLPDGSSIEFDKLGSVSLPGKPEVLLCTHNNISVNQTCNSTSAKIELTLPKIIALAATDAINPCVYAILVWILISILTFNPENKKKVLLAGLAFASAVFIIYLLYGIAIVAFFQFVQALASVKVLLYKLMAVLAIILGLINLRDFFSYKPGRAGSEMPLMFRPKVKKIISGVTSPWGAFGVGAFVTIFLLPCTIGPYIIAGGILSSLQLVNALPWLLFYNLIFVLPIIIITLIIFGGMSSVQDVSGWKDKNIRYIHLAEGIIALLLGLAMLTGLI